MASKVEICNQALTKIGGDLIASLSENNKPSKLCKLHFDNVRDQVLRDHPWNFALKRALLPAYATAPDFGYQFRYLLPSDYLRVVEVNNFVDSVWAVEDGFILTDIGAPLPVKYVRRVTDTRQFDASFIEMLATRLAAELATPLLDDPELRVDMFNLYNNKLRDARTSNAQESAPEDYNESSWYEARFYPPRY